MNEKIVWAKRVFPSLWNDSYKSILCYTVGLLCSDRVMFACNTGAKGDSEECIKKKNVLGEKRRKEQDGRSKEKPNALMKRLNREVFWWDVRTYLEVSMYLLGFVAFLYLLYSFLQKL